VDLLEMLNYELLGNSVVAWVSSFVLFLAVWAALGTLRRIVRKRLLGSVDHTAAPALQVARHVAGQTAGWFLLLMSLYAGSRLLVPGPWTEGLIPRVATIGLVIQLGLWATAALTMFLTLRRAHQLAADPSTVAAIDLVGFLVRLVVWAAVLLVLLDNLGVNVTTLIAGLGVGGIAVALAAQNVLGDLFSSLSIVLDKPFVVGDFIVVGDFLGSVEHVGLKTTRLRSLSGEQLVFSNSDLLNSRVRNYGRMFERRIVSAVRVTYRTPTSKVAHIPAMIREIVEGQEKVRFDRAHFQAFGEFALLFEFVYYVLTPDYNLYMDVQQRINLSLFERFAAEGIEFAYPTQTVLVSRDAG
jgi:small-conductance mechanosensitive channel